MEQFTRVVILDSILLRVVSSLQSPQIQESFKDAHRPCYDISLLPVISCLCHRALISLIHHKVKGETPAIKYKEQGRFRMCQMQAGKIIAHHIFLQWNSN